MSHGSPTCDPSGLAADLNVGYPVDRLRELAVDRVIGAVGPDHLSFPA